MRRTSEEAQPLVYKGVIYVTTNIATRSNTRRRRRASRAVASSTVAPQFMLGALAQFTEEPCIVDCDDGLLDLTVVPAMDGPAYLDTFAQLLRDGAAGIQASLVTTRSAWIAYDSESEINVNLDGEPLVFKHNASTHQTPIARNIRRTKRLREISSSRRFSRSVGYRALGSAILPC